MHTILKVIGFFIGLFAIINGLWLVVTPPFGDEPQGYIIIIAGCIVLGLMLFVIYGEIRRTQREKEYY